MANRTPQNQIVRGGGYFEGLRLGLVVAVLLLINALSQVDRILPFILAESIKADLGLSDTEIGLLTGLAFAVVHSLLSLPLARWADRGSPRMVLVSGIVIWSTLTAFGGVAASFAFLALTRFGVALGEATALPSGNALIARSVRPERRGLAIGLFAMGIPLGSMVGFAAGGVLNDTMGWRATLVGAGALGALIALAAFLVIGRTPPLGGVGHRGESFWATCRHLLGTSGFRWLLIAAVFVGFTTGPFYSFAVPFLIREHGLSATQAGLAFGLLQGLMGLVGTALAGRLFDRATRLGHGRLVGPPAVAFLVAAVSTVGALFAPNGWVAVATSILMIGSGLLGPALGPLAVGLISDAVTSAGQSGGLGYGLLVAPVFALLTAAAFFVANRRVAADLAPDPGTPQG